MKETRYFYAPDIARQPELPPEEAAHAVRVLRLGYGDALQATDGRGNLYACRVTEASPRRCTLSVGEARAVGKGWPGRVCLAVAPTKHIDRTEWLAEKVTEIGIDTIELLLCDFSERRAVKTGRIEKIMAAAMTQSHKAWLPRLAGPTPFREFAERPFPGQKFIAHCYAPDDIAPGAPAKPGLPAALAPGGDALVCVGPEGDFSIEEVRLAVARGFVPVSLGESRLRTETAGLVAVHLMRLAQDGVLAAGKD